MSPTVTTVTAQTIEITTFDTLGGVLALIIGVVAILSVLGIAVIMTIGAVTPSRSPVTSWPMEQEHAFAGFERRNASSQSSAWIGGILAGVVVFIAAFGIYKGVTPDMRDITKDMNMSNLTKKSTAAPRTEAPKTEAPKTETPKTPPATK